MCGWAVVAKEGHSIAHHARGLLPVQLPVQRTIKRAELWAFLHALRYVVPPMVFHTDHQGILDGVLRGKRWCCHSQRPCADVWLKIWHILDQHVLGCRTTGIIVAKVKAHVTATMKKNMASHELYHVHGNETADAYAKDGADLDHNFGKQQAIKELTDEVTAAGTMIGAMQAHMQQREEKDKECIVVIKGKRAQPELRVGSDHPCVVRRVRAKTKGKDQWRCTVCRRSTRSKRTVGIMQMQQCPGSARARLKPHESHRIIDTGTFLYCRVCGVYGVDKGFNLRKRCKGKFVDSAVKTGGQLSRLRRGLHPLSGKRLLLRTSGLAVQR